jgi:hypothetical protein
MIEHVPERNVHGVLCILPFSFVRIERFELGHRDQIRNENCSPREHHLEHTKAYVLSVSPPEKASLPLC